MIELGEVGAPWGWFNGGAHCNAALGREAVKMVVTEFGLGWRKVLGRARVRGGGAGNAGLV